MIRQKKRAQLKLLLLSFVASSVFAITSQADEQVLHDHDQNETSAPKVPGTLPTSKPESLHMGHPNSQAVTPYGAVHNDGANRERTQVYRQGVQEHYPGIQRSQGIQERYQNIQHPQGIQEHRQVVREHHDFHEHDVHRFDRDELAIWRGGRWHNSCYGGRCGWWWFAGGEWYFYDRPIYPYPLEVSVETYAEPVQEAPVVQPAPVFANQPQQHVWYFCVAANAYYPYVSLCPSGWQTVPATPQPDSSSNQSAAPPQ
ncbi:MAG: hypothetical protein WA435_05525 [Gallionellaceae bacterium]